MTARGTDNKGIASLPYGRLAMTERLSLGGAKRRSNLVYKPEGFVNVLAKPISL